MAVELSSDAHTTCRFPSQNNQWLRGVIKRGPSQYGSIKERKMVKDSRRGNHHLPSAKKSYSAQTPHPRPHYFLPFPSLNPHLHNEHNASNPAHHHPLRPNHAPRPPSPMPPQTSNPARNPHPAATTPLHLHTTSHTLRRLHLYTPHDLACPRLCLYQGHAQHANVEPKLPETDECGGGRGGEAEAV